ncbi:hypothetical protein O1611_g5242 [Lasiodiplodia mahajangana]|uniref:Uncharacterized protein n=1 Tax=Lasiodiplodia mahajangana TaxID=1108764 RepID=A0ACC2JLJ8_9PEZI|nr:hypothetical protein O1611_g5242 [Lasiodiplodia mahajangana]
MLKMSSTSTESLKEYNDPQAIFYLISLEDGHQLPQKVPKDPEDMLTTLYFWATRIENTVSQNGNQGKDTQASWDRAAYRAKLLDYLTRSTPWMMVISDDAVSLPEEPITGEYDHDKHIYQKTVHQFLEAKVPEIPVAKLLMIERYIAETMVLGQHTLSGVLRFALALPLTDTGSSAQLGFRVLTLAFEKISGGRAMTMKASETSYQAGLNQDIFDHQTFDPEDLERGKALVLDAAFDVAA